MPDVLLNTASVAALLALSVERVRQLDGELFPLRTARGHRLYLPEAVEKVRQDRDARRCARENR